MAPKLIWEFIFNFTFQTSSQSNYCLYYLLNKASTLLEKENLNAILARNGLIEILR